ncbi:MAG: hypothetical protein ACREV8_09680 [Gammaproteobacteria bacterium]
MSLIVVGLAALGGYGQEVRAEQPAEIARAAGQPVEQPMEASGEASEKIREANEAIGGLLDEENSERVDGVMAVDNALSWTMRYP